MATEVFDAEFPFTLHLSCSRWKRNKLNHYLIQWYNKEWRFDIDNVEETLQGKQYQLFIKGAVLLPVTIQDKNAQFFSDWDEQKQSFQKSLKDRFSHASFPIECSAYVDAPRELKNV
jgi:hypothetical protein